MTMEAPRDVQALLLVTRKRGHLARVCRRGQKFIASATVRFPESTTMRIGALLLALAAVLVTAEAHKSKFLPAMRASLSLGSSLLRHVAEIKDRLREDIERQLLRHVEPHHHPGLHFMFGLPSWKKPALQQLWMSPAFHSSFSFQSSSSGPHMLPLPFFPRPMPAIAIAPCRNIRTRIAHFVLPCIRITSGEFQRPVAGLGASQPNNVTQGTSNVTADTTSDLAPRVPTSTVTYGTDPVEQYVTGVVTRAVDVTTDGETTSTPTYETTTENGETTSTPTYETTTETGEVTPTTTELSSDVTATDAVSLALGTRADDVTTVTDSPDVEVTSEAGYEKSTAQEPANLDRKGNMILDMFGIPTTSTNGNARNTTEQPTSSATDDMNFNEILKEAEAAFAKLSDQ
ncbi:mucin-17-like isoform X2 [Dermacentor albipictus]|uniref:mucin-17-like isoform X2 n=1 Tax=Dermacentor albipictus TaxID=60249 RepID=UPI0038FD04C5